MASRMTAKATKASLRQRIVACREQLGAEARTALSRRILERLLEMPEYQNAQAVLGYMNFGAEFYSRLWVEKALAARKEVWLPRVNHETGELDAYRIQDLQRDLITNMWGIDEPRPERCAKLDDLARLDFMLLPGIAFTREGARLGYGGGFYDKLLARFGTRVPVLAAAAFAMQIVEHLPQEPTDRKVEWLVTEDETIRCKGA